ncbi:MAG TPA: hypothetical protein VGP68_00275 [Gemmataceae bacterium]|jgi:hypothetical protein|nr:hypothetical protein [Gemmataceae bacterium]
MLATVRTVGQSDTCVTSHTEGAVKAGGFVSFVSPPFDLPRVRRFHAILPVSIQHVDARRFVFDLDEDDRDLLADNPALLTGLFPQEAPRWQAVAYELGSDNYIG